MLDKGLMMLEPYLGRFSLLARQVISISCVSWFWSVSDDTSAFFFFYMLYDFYLGHIVQGLTWHVGVMMALVAAYGNSKKLCYHEGIISQPQCSLLLLLKWEGWTAFLLGFRKAMCDIKTSMFLKCYWIEFFYLPD